MVFFLFSFLISILIIILSKCFPRQQIFRSDGGVYGKAVLDGDVVASVEVSPEHARERSVTFLVFFSSYKFPLKHEREM